MPLNSLSLSQKSNPLLDDFTQVQTLVDLVRYQSLKHPTKTAFVFLEDGERESQRLTYQEIDEQVRKIAAKLQALKAKGERALLLYPSGLEFITAFLGCLYAGVIAVPLYPPKRNQKLNRIQAVVDNCQAKFVLTTEAAFKNTQGQLTETPELAHLQWLITDNPLDSSPEQWQSPDISGESLAFLQYTSGSTGTPKGVMVSHGNLLENLRDLDLGLEHSPDSILITWLPTFHDMGLIYGVLEPIYKGMTCYMMNPVSFLQNPFNWLQAMSVYQGTHTAAPNFAYELCLHKISEEQKKLLNLQHWKMALNGAEPIRAEVLEKFAQFFQSCGFNASAFCPGYGLAEATLKVTTVPQKEELTFYTVQADQLEKNLVVRAERGQQGTYTLVGCGRSDIDTSIIIVNPDSLTQAKPDEVGEIWLSGATVTQGYWNQPELTKTVFKAYLKDTQQGPFLRTGDMGFIAEDQLFITGRLKDIIIIRGLNHYPQDIEKTIENSHPSIRQHCSAAFSMEIEGEERLIIMAEVERRYMSRRRQSDNEYPGEDRRQSSDRRQQQIEPGNEPLERSPYDPQNIFKTFREAIAQHHQLQIYQIVLLRPGSIPKTSSGKIQRHACRIGLQENTLNIVDQWKISLDISTPLHQTQQEPLNLDSLEADLTHWLMQWLSNNLGISIQSLELDASFLSYGLDSAKAIKLTHDLEMAFDYPVAQTFALDYPSIQSLIKDLNEKILMKTRENSKESEPVNSKQITELSGNPEEIIAKIEEISDQEVDLMLTQLLAEEENPQ